MCVICTEWIRGKMTGEEALRALGEMIRIGAETSKPDYHYYEVLDEILDKNPELEDVE